MTAAELAAWIERAGYRSNTAAARDLGIAPNSMTAYLHGRKPVPRTVELACKGLVLERMLALVA